jgi:hypothetical protein
MRLYIRTATAREGPRSPDFLTTSRPTRGSAPPSNYAGNCFMIFRKRVRLIWWPASIRPRTSAQDSIVVACLKEIDAFGADAVHQSVFLRNPP